MPATTIYVYGLHGTDETARSRLRNTLPGTAARIEGLNIRERKVIVYLLPDISKEQEGKITIRVEGLWHGKPSHDLGTRNGIAQKFGEAAQKILVGASYMQCQVVPPIGEPGVWESPKL